MSIICLCVLAGVEWTGCRSETEKPQDLKPQDLPNVLLFTIDTLRADHLGCYGYEKARTPNIDRLAAEGTRFAQCMTAAPITFASHATIMTGMYPFTHGIRLNGERALHAKNVLLAEILQEAGYTTHGEVALYIMNAGSGMDQGFSSYNDVPMPAMGRRVDEHFRRFAQGVGDSTVDWIRRNASKRFFVWSHFFDPHKSYKPPEPYASACETPYDAEIAYVDAQIGRLMDLLKELDLELKTLVVFTSDHGEGLWDHGLETHGILVYDSTMSVPLIFRQPGTVLAGQVIDSQVRTIDITPSILDLVGLAPGEGMQGVSLTPLIDGSEEDLSLLAYGESLTAAASLGYSPLRCIRYEGWKYMHSSNPELYNVVDDPGEKNDLVKEQPERVRAMRDMLRTLIVESEIASTRLREATEIGPEEVRRLEAIGYLSNSASPGAVGSKSEELAMLDSTAPAPKDRLKAIYWMLEPIKEAADENDMQRAATCCRNALEIDPKMELAHRKLAIALIRMGRPSEAARHLEGAVKLLPEQVRLRRMLADLLLKAGETDKAFEHYSYISKRKPEDVEVRFTLAEIHLKRNQPEQAITHFSKILETNPKEYRAHHGLGVACIQKGDLPRAEEHLAKAIDINPLFPEAHKGLGEVYMKQGKVDAAIRHFSESLRLRDDDPGLHTALGNLLYGRKRYADAAKHYRKAVKLKVDAVEPANYLAWILATTGDEDLRDGRQAVELAERAARLTGNKNATILDTLAAAYAEVGRFADAVSTASQARELAASAKQEKLVKKIERQLEHYRKNKPIRE